MLRIVKGIEPIPVDHPVFMLFGQPGIGKTSLGYSAKDALLLDFDRGAHRAANRRDTLTIDAWEDVIEMMAATDVLQPYATLVVDTVGRCLDLMTAHIAQTQPKLAPNGNLTLQGWGTLRTNFRTWMTALRALGKDVLLLSHDREDKDGDTRIVRPEIPGSSYTEVMKISDFVGYFQMSGKNRVLDFNPSDRWIAKNPANWTPFVIPPIGKATEFMADLFTKGRDALGRISQESATIAAKVDEWRTAIESYTTPQEINRAIGETKDLPTVASPQVKKLLNDRAKALGFVWNQKAKAFEAQTVAAAS